MKVNKQDFLNIKTLIECGTITERKFKNQEIVAKLKLNGAVTNSQKRSRKYIDLVNEENIFLFLRNYDYLIDSVEELDNYIEIFFDKKVPRDTIQQYHNNSKAKTSKSMHGLYLSSLQKLDITLDGNTICILPNDGLGYFFFHTQKVEVSKSTVIVGVENYQVVWFAKRYEKFFDKPNILFVYKSAYMLEWISTLENEYIHFGDYDLAGVNIYLNTIVPRLVKSKTHSMFIPENIEQLIEKHGISELYEKQKQYKNLRTDDAEITCLIEIITRFKKGFEQEGLSLCSDI